MLASIIDTKFAPVHQINGSLMDKTGQLPCLYDAYNDRTQITSLGFGEVDIFLMIRLQVA